MKNINNNKKRWTHQNTWMECKNINQSQIIQQKERGGKTFCKTGRDECFMFLCSRRPTIGKSRPVVIENPITISLGSWCIVQHQHRCRDLFHIHAVKSKHGQNKKNLATTQSFHQYQLLIIGNIEKKKISWKYLKNWSHPQKRNYLHAQNNTICTTSDHGFRMFLITCTPDNF